MATPCGTILAAASMVALLAMPASAAETADIERFHRQVYAQTLSPPSPESFRTVCEAELPGQRVSFIASGRGPVIIAGFTNAPIADPRKDISPQPAFYMREGQQGLSVTAGPVADWAYIWDRNRDGRIDYVAYLIGPNPLKPENPAYNPPAPGKPFESKDQYMAVMKSLRQVFWHMADEDFDGEADAFALMGREKSGWWRDWVIVHARGENLEAGASAPAPACSFMGGERGRVARCEPAKGDRLSFNVPGEDLIAFFPTGKTGTVFDLMRSLQKAGAQCNFKAGDIVNQ